MNRDELMKEIFNHSENYYDEMFMYPLYYLKTISTLGLIDILKDLNNSKGE